MHLPKKRESCLHPAWANVKGFLVLGFVLAKGRGGPREANVVQTVDALIGNLAAFALLAKGVLAVETNKKMKLDENQRYKRKTTSIGKTSTSNQSTVSPYHRCFITQRPSCRFSGQA